MLLIHLLTRTGLKGNVVTVVIGFFALIGGIVDGISTPSTKPSHWDLRITGDVTFLCINNLYQFPYCTCTAPPTVQCQNVQHLQITIVNRINRSLQAPAQSFLLY